MNVYKANTIHILKMIEALNKYINTASDTHNVYKITKALGEQFNKTASNNNTLTPDMFENLNTINMNCSAKSPKCESENNDINCTSEINMNTTCEDYDDNNKIFKFKSVSNGTVKIYDIVYLLLTNIEISAVCNLTAIYNEQNSKTDVKHIHLYEFERIQNGKTYNIIVRIDAVLNYVADDIETDSSMKMEANTNVLYRLFTDMESLNEYKATFKDQMEITSYTDDRDVYLKRVTISDTCVCLL